MKKMIGFILLFFSFFSYGKLNHAIVADFLGQAQVTDAEYQAGLAQMKKIMESPHAWDDDILQRFLGITQEKDHFKRPEWLKGEQTGDVEESFFKSLQRVRAQHVCFLGSIPLDHASSLFELCLEKKNIRHLAPGLFQSFTALQWLSLSGNQLTQLSDNIFIGLAGLQKLYLERNKITQLPGDVFAKLSGLQELYLGENQLSGFSLTVFGSLSGLQKLCLERNKIAQLPVGAFVGLSGLQKLSLRENKIAQLPVGVFVGLTQLQELYLNDNKIELLSDDLFVGLSELRKLNFYNNKLRTLDARFFARLTSLQELYLERNQIAHLPDEVFARLTSLQKLNLNDNHLTQLSDGIFLKLPYLQELSLKGNKISKLSDGVFLGLTCLRLLNLSDNQLLQLPASIGRLKYLALVCAKNNPLFSLTPSSNQWGKVELERKLGKRFTLSEAPLLRPTQAKKVSPGLTGPHPLRFSRPLKGLHQTTEEGVQRIAQTFGAALKTARFVFPLVTLENPEQVLEWFETVWKNWHGNPETIAAFTNGEYTSPEALKNRLVAYLKGLFDLPLERGEITTWQPRGPNKDALQKALPAILRHLKENPIQIPGAFDQLYLGLLNCPTGQWEAAVTVMHGLQPTEVTGSRLEMGLPEAGCDLWNQVRTWLGQLKERLFQRVILSRGGVKNINNVYLLAYYADLLRDDLGLAQNAFGTTTCPTGNDPFRGNKWMVAHLYYKMLQDRLIPELQDAMKNPESPLHKTAVIQLWEEDYLSEAWWTANPIEDESASLTQFGAKRFLEEMFVLK